MNSFLDLNRTLSARHNQKIKKICAPLFACFNLNYFNYSKLFNDGSFTRIASDVGWDEYFSGQSFYLTYPFYRHPKFFQSAILLPKEINKKAYIKIINTAKCKFNIHQKLTIINKTEEGIEEFGFGSNISNEMLNTMLLNEMPLLRLFIKKFREENRSLFSLMKENLINLAQIIGPDFHKNALPEWAKPVGKLEFLKKMGIQMEGELSLREAGVIELMLKGYTPSQIALQVHLSKRTVEHHIERIKDKLGCYSKAELIQKGRELEQLRCL